MLKKHTYKFLLTGIILLALIGFTHKTINNIGTPFLDQIQAIETDIAPKPNGSNQTIKGSTEPTEAEKRHAYEASLLDVLPASLRAVPSPERLDVDAAGNLVINAKIRRMFDHYLSTIGEEDLHTVTNRIKLLLQRQLSDPALSQAQGIFDNYIVFKGAMDGILQQSAQFQSGQLDGPAIAALKQQIRLERSNYFSPEVISAFFTREDQYDDYMLAKSQITNDETLSSEDTLAAMAQLNQRSPAWLTQRDSKTKKIEAYQAKELALTKSGAQAWEIKDLRRRELGEEAAAKLELRDQRRASWDQRLLAYREAVETAMQQYSAPDTPSALAKRDQIRAEHFKDHELRRVISLDAITRKD
ncbi:MAG: lipase secretion chaperone [Hellea sp.]